MILYALACDTGHRFETWFRDSEAFEDQAARRLVECPACRSTSVAKTIMAPAVLSARAPRGGAVTPAAPATPPLLDADVAAARTRIRELRQKILAEAEDTGANFSAEARRMHEGETPQRPIHGQASLDEARGLLEDGILVLPLPSVPEELN